MASSIVSFRGGGSDGSTASHFEPHHYRHTYATWLLRRGAGVESVKELLGHVFAHRIRAGCSSCTRRPTTSPLQKARSVIDLGVDRGAQQAVGAEDLTHLGQAGTGT